jgi:hypothetical protein
MPLNLWWIDQPAERYWMEITDRPILGEDLTAPQTRDGGDEYWSYSLVTEARPGDVVLHWHKNLVGEPAIIGWSVVTGPLAEGQITWQARGTSGRARGRATTGPSWIMPCDGFNELPRPVTKAELLRNATAIKRIRHQLEDQVGTAYFPFVFYASGGTSITGIPHQVPGGAAGAATGTARSCCSFGRHWRAGRLPPNRPDFRRRRTATRPATS